MIESNYIEMSHKWELIQSSTKFLLTNSNELNESITWINEKYDRDLSDIEVKEIEQQIESKKKELDRLKHLINVRWTRF